MANHESNPWDTTIWDPFNTEQAIEDPAHGPSAVVDMLQIPAMPYGDGTYYQPGTYYATGTAYVDSKGRPVWKVGMGSSSMCRTPTDLYEWVTTFDEGGEDALVGLEASRQRGRLETTGFANCYKLNDVCPGGKRLSDCEIGSATYQTAQEWAARNSQERPGDGTVFNTLAAAVGRCAACQLSCEAAVMTIDGRPDETRVTFYRPLQTAQTIRLDLGQTLLPSSIIDTEQP